MDPEDFRRHAHTFVDWMADYMEGVGGYPVRSQAKPGEIAGKLSASAPASGEDMALIFEDFQRDILPGITHWQHPNFHAYFPGNSSPPSVLAEMLTATMGAQCMVWETSPAATEMETRVMDWLCQMLGLGEGFQGVIQDSASSATLIAVMMAREKATNWAANSGGLGDCPSLTFYTSLEAHSSVLKAVKVAGLGESSLRLIGVDDQFAMRADLLNESIKSDIASGYRPAGVIATLGTTGVGANDPVRAIGEICKAHDLFFHVDAAWAGSALILPEHRDMIDGIGLVDSFSFNPHKWLMTNFDCAAHFVRSPDDLVRTLGILPEYLKTVNQGQVIDYRDWSVPLGRRFRALKLWFVIRSYGVEGLQAILRDHIAWTDELAGWIETDPDFELMASKRLGLINFRYCPADKADAEVDSVNEILLSRVNDDGRIYLTRNKIGGAFCIRFSIGQTRTTHSHIVSAWAVIKEIAAGL